MMKTKILYPLAFVVFLFINPCAFAQWTAPVKPTLSDNNVSAVESGKSYYIKNVGAGQFITGSNSWSTQISLTRDGVGSEYSPALLIYVADSTALNATGVSLRLDGTFIVNGASGKRTFTNTYLFRDGEESGFMDHGTQAKGYIWKITKAENGYFRIQTADGDASFPNSATQYAGWDSSRGPIAIDETGELVPFNLDEGIYPYTEVRFNMTGAEENEKIDWMFIDPSEYLKAMEDYKVRKELYDALVEASEAGVDATTLNAAGAVYTNASATAEEMQKQKAHLLAAMAGLKYNFSDASDSNPLDVTEQVLVNPTFDSNIDGWTITVTGQNLQWQQRTDGSVDASKNWVSITNFIEAWRPSSQGGLGDGTISQTVYGLPAGKYILECDAMATRQGGLDGKSAEDAVEGAYIFIEGESGEVRNAIKAPDTQPKHWSVVFISDGSDWLTFGLKAESTTANWLSADNFKLTYYGETSRTQAQLDLEAALAKANELKEDDSYRGYVPTLKAFEALIESGQNLLDGDKQEESVYQEATEALTAAQDSVKATIAAYEVLYKYWNSELDKYIQIATQMTWYDLANEFKETKVVWEKAYNEGTMPDAEIYALTDAIYPKLLAAINPGNIEKDTDLTWLLKNPSFDEGTNGWTMIKDGGNTGTVSVDDGIDYHNIEFWRSKFDISQTIANMPAGVYEITIQGFSCNEDDQVNPNSDIKIELYAGNSTAKFMNLLDPNQLRPVEGNEPLWTGANPDRVFEIDGVSYYAPHSMGAAAAYFATMNEKTGEPYYTNHVNVTLSQKGDFTIGVRSFNKSEWVVFDNIKLKYLGNANYILFADANVKAICVANWDTDGDGELGYEEAAAVSDLGEVFKNDSVITSFNELQYFTGLTSIGQYAFLQCSRLTSVKIPENVTSLERSAFAGCSALTAIAIPQSVTSLGAYAFANCTNLSSVNIPNGITILNDRLFASCTSLNSITIPNSVTSIGSSFWKCSGLISITIPNSVTTIGESAFNHCANLSSIIIPSSVTSIGNYAFQYCFSLTSVTIGDGVTSIGRGAFDSCERLSSVYITDLEAWCKIDFEIYTSHPFSNGKEHHFYINGVEMGNQLALPSGITSIGKWAFYGCNCLNSVTIPNSVTDIGICAFSGCHNLASISVDSSNTTLDSRDNCNAIINSKANELIVGCMSTVIPSSVESIGAYAFRDCSGLQSITIPNSLTAINYCAFYNCSNLTSVTSDIMIPFAIQDNVFWGVNSSCVLYVPTEALSLYEQTEGWNAHFSKIDEKPLIISATSMSREYGEANPTWVFTSTGGEPNGIPAFSCEATETSPVGTYDIIVSQGSVTNTNVTYVKGTLTITKAPLTITANATSMKQGEETPKFTVTYSGFMNGETEAVLTKQPTFICEATEASPIGSYPIIVEAAEAQNYDITYVNGTLTVNDADPIVIKANSYSRKYGEENPNFEYTTEGANLKGTPLITCEATATTPVGEYPIAISKGNVQNYNDSYSNGTLTITKAPLTITVNPVSKKQGEAVPKFTLTYSGFKNGETEAVLTQKPIITCDVTADSPKGNYPITVSGAEAQNYDITFVNGTLTVKEADPIVITANNCSREYGEDNPTFEFSSIGATIHGAPSISCEATILSPVGEYPIVITKGGVTNYNDSYVNGTLTVTKAPLIVGVKDCSRYVKEANPTFELTYSGFKNGETEVLLTRKPTVTCEATDESPVGLYAITISGGEAENYELIYVNGTLTVEVPPNDVFVVDNMTFQVSEQTTEKVVAFVRGPETEDFAVPSSVNYSGLNYSVTALADGAFANMMQLKSIQIPASIQVIGDKVFENSPHLAAIMWEAAVPMTKEMAGSLADNPNLLFFTTDPSKAWDGLVNIVNPQTKRAERIVLADTEENNDFYCPIEFTADEISYTHEYKLFTEAGKCQGWESLSLPFDVKEITHETKGIITPFGALQRGREYENDTRPFWLYEYTTNGSFSEAESIEANTPYIISMPNEAKLWRDYILEGSVTFKSTNAKVKATSGAKVVKSGALTFKPSYQYEALESAYLLNVNKNYDGNPKGSVFVKNLRNARPFEAYFELEGSAGVKPYFGVFEHLTDGIRSIAPAMRDGDTEYYQLDGTKRTSPQRGFNIVRTKNGAVHKALIK